MSFNLSRIPPLTAELAALECLTNQTYNLVNTLVPSCLIGSSSFLLVHVTRTTVKTGMSSNFDQIGLLTVELAALERLEKSL